MYSFGVYGKTIKKKKIKRKKNKKGVKLKMEKLEKILYFVYVFVFWSVFIGGICCSLEFNGVIPFLIVLFNIFLLLFYMCKD